MSARPPPVTFLDQARALFAAHTVEELRAMWLKSPVGTDLSAALAAAIRWKVAAAMRANGARDDAANPPSEATLASRENTRRIQLGRVEADLGMPTAAELLSADIDDAVQAAWVEFMGADGKVKKQPVITVTNLSERGLEQDKVGFTQLVAFLADQGLSFHARCEALRRLARRGMPIGGRTRRPEFDAAPTPSPEVDTTNPEE